MTSAKQELETALGDLLREFKACHPELLEHIIEGLMGETGCSRDGAIRSLAEFEIVTRHLLEASKSIGEA